MLIRHFTAAFRNGVTLACLSASGNGLPAWLGMIITGWLYDYIPAGRQKNRPESSGRRKTAFVLNGKIIESHDDTSNALQTGRPGRKLRLFPDKGYETQWLENYLKSWRDESLIQSRKTLSDACQNTDFKAYKWITKRTHSGMNRFRRIRIRREKSRKP